MAQKKPSGDEYRALPYWNALLETLAERKPSLAAFFRNAKGYYSQKDGFLIKVAGDFAVALINGPDVLHEVKALVSEHEKRNVMSEPFSVISDSKAKENAMQFIDELEELIGDNQF